MINVCSVHKLIFRIESFTLDEYHHFISELLHNVPSLHGLSYSDFLHLKKELIKILNYHAISRGMGVLKINLE